VTLPGAGVGVGAPAVPTLIPRTCAPVEAQSIAFEAVVAFIINLEVGFAVFEQRNFN
jgi:hypothetical protein